MMVYLTMLETIISSYWLTNTIFFKKVIELGDVNNKCKECFFSSIFSIFFQNLDWMFFQCTLYNLYKFFQDPAHEKSGYAYKFKWYVFISFSVSLLYTYFVLIAEIFGLSVKLF